MINASAWGSRGESNPLPKLTAYPNTGQGDVVHIHIPTQNMSPRQTSQLPPGVGQLAPGGGGVGGQVHASHVKRLLPDAVGQSSRQHQAR